MTQIKHKNVVLYTDGAARGNPGPAAIGVVICRLGQDRSVILKTGKAIGDATNNQAEYRALIWGLGICKEIGAKTVAHFTDSQLVHFQVTGKWKIRSAPLRELKAEVDRLVKGFERVSFGWVRREERMIQVADNMANQALDERR